MWWEVCHALLSGPLSRGLVCVGGGPGEMHCLVPYFSPRGDSRLSRSAQPAGSNGIEEAHFDQAAMGLVPQQQGLLRILHVELQWRSLQTRTQGPEAFVHISASEVEMA